MQTAETILQQAIVLEEDDNYNKIIELLVDELLSLFKNAELYAIKAQAYWKLEEFDLSLISATSALLEDSNNVLANYYSGRCYQKKENFEKALEYYDKAVSIDPQLAFIYDELGAIYIGMQNAPKAIEVFTRRVNIDPNSSVSHLGLGSVYYNIDEPDKAIEHYGAAVKADRKFSYAYSGLGDVYLQKRDYKTAIFYFNKAIKFENDATFFQKLGRCFTYLKESKKAISYYSKAIKINPKIADFYYDRGLDYHRIGRYQEATSDYEKFLEFTDEDATTYHTTITKIRLNDLKEIIQNPELRFVDELVEKIKDLLTLKEQYITHYTSFSTAKALILEDSLFRLSEGTFLNDTSEGRELFNFLPSLPTPTIKLQDTEAKPFIPKPFIGSFVADKNHDDLTLWRMYGKEAQEEAKGCAITIDRELFIKGLRSYNLNADEIILANELKEDEFSFYRVAYRKHGTDERFVIPGATNDEVLLNKLLFKLKQKLEVILSEKKIIGIKNWSKLNQIAYLFKSGEYQYENELRLIVNGNKFPKYINKSAGPIKVYIELLKISPLIKKITFGPKVTQADEWASIFYYSLDRQGYHPDIFISHLPFK